MSDLLETVPLTRKTYNIQKAGIKYLESDGTMTPSLLYRMQLAVFNAKMDLLNFIIKEGMVPCSDDEVEVEIRVLRRAISAEATDGEWITLPVNMYAFEKLQYEGIPRAN